MHGKTLLRPQGLFGRCWNASIESARVFRVPWQVAGVPMVIIVNNTDAVKASSAREALTILAILVSVQFAGLIAIFLFMLRGIAATFIVNGLRRLFGIPPGLTRHGGPALGGGSVGGYGDFGGGFSGDGGGGGGKW